MAAIGEKVPWSKPRAASKAAGDVLAEVMAFETARYGIETVIVQPGAYTSGTDHFKHAVGFIQNHKRHTIHRRSPFSYHFNQSPRRRHHDLDTFLQR